MLHNMKNNNEQTDLTNLIDEWFELYEMYKNGELED